MWVGGRGAAESKQFMEDNDIKFVVTAVGKDNERFVYPYEPGDDFKVFILPVGYQGDKRDRFDLLCLFNII